VSHHPIETPLFLADDGSEFGVIGLAGDGRRWIGGELGGSLGL
jgi:hypothetical protein